MCCHTVGVHDGAARAVKVVDGFQRKTAERLGLHSLGVWCVRGVYGR